MYLWTTLFDSILSFISSLRLGESDEVLSSLGLTFWAIVQRNYRAYKLQVMTQKIKWYDLRTKKVKTGNVIAIYLKETNTKIEQNSQLI